MTDIDIQPEVPVTKFIMSDKVYQRIRFLIITLLPAISALYFALGSIWGLPAVEQVIGTIAAITVFLSALVGISTKAYNASGIKFDGTIAVAETETGGKRYLLELKDDPETLDQKDTVIFKVGS